MNTFSLMDFKRPWTLELKDLATLEEMQQQMQEESM
jgi:hypothetical protein